MDERPGLLFVLSGPSGVGKDALLDRMRESGAPYHFAITATTRQMRPDERDGVDYHFLSTDEFERRRRAGEFLECFEVFDGGTWYGTLESEVAPSLEAAKSIVLEIDVQGATAIVKRYPQAITIFVLPSSPDKSQEELERRLRGRGTDSEESIHRRLDTARRELKCADRYRHQVVNDDVETAVKQICDIIRSP